MRKSIIVMAVIGLLALAGGYFYLNPTTLRPSPAPTPSTKMDETKEIMDAAKASFPDNKIQGVESEIKFNKQVGDYARLTASATKQTLDPLTIIMQKKEGNWSVVNYGTSFPELEEQTPELFKD